MATTTLLLMDKGEAANLEDIIRACVETEVSWGLMENDIVFAVAFWSMAECGFQPTTPEESRKHIKEKSQMTLPKGWKHETRKVYEAEFFLPPFSECPVKLVALPADDILCINVLASNVSPRNISLRSLAIHSSGYVPSPEKDKIRCKFSGLNDFHLLLRDVIIWPIRCSILTDRGVMNGSLCGLSEEMKLKIIRQLNVRDILMVAQTCHDLNRISNDPGLWKGIFHEQFSNSCKCGGNIQNCDETIDWKESFKRLYGQRQKSEGSIQQSTSESYHTAHDIVYGSEIDFDIE